jgi:hypothetical protein
MSSKITWKYLLAFIALNMLMGELHEQAHIQTGFAICGCYGERDFNVWETCTNCVNSGLSYLATVSGPVFSYVVYWFCALVLLQSSNAKKINFGIALLFATLPFARRFPACMGGGDEKTVLIHLLQGYLSIPLIKLMAAGFVLLFCLPPIMIAVKLLPKKNRWLYILGFNIGPLIFGMLWQRFFLNKLLVNPVWANTDIAGTPVMIILHCALMLVLLGVFRKALMTDKSLPIS